MIASNTPENNNSRPDYIANNHWEEWIESGVKPSIISANIYTEYDAREFDKALNRNNKSRWKHSDSLVPAWLVRGVDPSSGQTDWGGIQAKPDNPQIRNGKPQKYLGACDYGASPLFLKVDDYDYWLKVIQDLKIPVIITEGAKKAACLLSNGYAAISIPGVSTCRKKGRLHKLIQKFCGFGRLFYLCFDNDITTKRPVQLALEGLARDLSATGSKVMVVSLPEGDAKGVDDYIVANSLEAFKQLIEKAKTIEEWKEDNDLSWAAKQEQIKNRKKSKLARVVETIHQAWGNFLRWNELSQSPELVNEKLEADDLRVKIALELDVDVTKDDSVTAIRTLAKKHSYHPIREYLLDVAESYKDIDLSIIDNLSTELFGNNSEICNIYMKKFLIGSVARIMQPGTKMDNAIILHGAEGIKKSTFWNVLFGEDWFSDSIDDSNGKDEKMLIHEYWCLEWSEFATVYRHKDIESLKKFLAQKNDSFRKPYERSISKHKRSCVFVGTTNNPEVLQDPGGRNRRFWIINVNQEIDIEKLREMRNKLWAAAYYCWQRGDIHYIPERSRESLLQDKENEQFKATHPWQEIIESFLIGKSQTHLGEIYDCLEIEKGRREARHQRQIVECLKVLGWDKTNKRGYGRNGSRPRLWERKNKSTNFYPEEDRNPQNNDISRESTVPPTDPPYDPPNQERNAQSAQTIVYEGFVPMPEIDPLTDPPLNPIQTELNFRNNKTDPPPENFTEGIQGEDLLVVQSESSHSKGFSQIDPLDHQKHQISKQQIKYADDNYPLPSPISIRHKGDFGETVAIVTPLKVIKKGGCLICKIELIYPDGSTEKKKFKNDGGKKQLQQAIEEYVGIWELQTMNDPKRRWDVMTLGDDDVIWIKDCEMIQIAHPPVECWYTFRAPTGEVLRVAGTEDFRLARGE